MSFAFAGTPRFASWVLRDLVDMGHRPVLVISQPDRPKGRGLCGTAPETAAEAARLGIECLQTADINSPSVQHRLTAAGASTLVVAAFGQLLREPLLGSVGCLNIHASLLPRHRGAAPIERALAAGDSVTGITIMRITEGLDEGDWAQQAEVSVGPRDDAGSLGKVLSTVGAVALVQVLDAIVDGTVVWREQEGTPCYAHKLRAEDCILDTTVGSRRVHDQVRALSPCIGARTVLGDMGVKVWRTWPHGQAGFPGIPAACAGVAGVPGRVATVGERLYVGCGEGVLEILELQPASRARMTASAFLRGYGGRVGECLGDVGPASGPDVA